jgi:hypothetical protein
MYCEGKTFLAGEVIYALCRKRPEASIQNKKLMADRRLDREMNENRWRND